MNKRLMRWLWPSVAALVLFGLNAWVQKLFAQSAPGDVLNVLVNSFTVPGVVLSGVGLLGWISTFGQFDMLAYSSRRLFGRFIRPLSDDLPSNFGDYRQQREEKGRSWNKPLLWVGLICLGLAGVLLAVYYWVQ